MKLRPLKPGDRIGLAAPSSPFDREAFERGTAVLEADGYRPVPGRHIFKRNHYLAGTDAERAEDLMQLLANPEISAVVCIRGGYGSGRLLSRLPFSSLRDHRKLFLGHSDITFLHLAFASQMGWITFLGPNLTGIGQFESQWEYIRRVLAGETECSWRFTSGQVLREGTAVGKVLGGNLTCLVHLVSTPFLPELEKVMLLVEDRGEAPYRLDRLFTQLKLSGRLERLAALLLGEFHECGDRALIHEMILEQVRDYSFPVVADLPFGHGSVNEAIPLNVEFSLNTYEGSLRAVQSPFCG